MAKDNLSDWTLKTEVMDGKSKGKNNPVKQELPKRCVDLKLNYICQLPDLNECPSFRIRPRKQSTPKRFIRPSYEPEAQPTQADKGKRKLSD